MSEHRDIARWAGKSYTASVRRNKYERDWHGEKSWPERIEAAQEQAGTLGRLATQCLLDWQKQAFRWALANPDHELILDSNHWRWEIRKSDQHVEFVSWDCGRQNERTWISRYGDRRTLVEQDVIDMRKAA